MHDLVMVSYQHSYQEEASKLLGEVEMLTQGLDEWGTENVVRVTLRTFARDFSNIDFFFLKVLPLKGDELVMSEM